MPTKRFGHDLMHIEGDAALRASAILLDDE